MRRALMLAVALSLASCAAPRNALNTTASPCFRALPEAAAAVHQKGSLVGVRHVETDQLARDIPAASTLGHRRVCGVAYRGNYAPGAVTGAEADHGGKYAVILVDDHLHVLAAYVVDHLPVRFTHRV